MNRKRIITSLLDSFIETKKVSFLHIDSIYYYSHVMRQRYTNIKKRQNVVISPYIYPISTPRSLCFYI